jgi:glutamate N-acetyltransferase/amino-acid N-acetyltransferase
MMAGSVITAPSGVTVAKGFRAAGVSAGIKTNKNADLALLVSETPATAAAVFTTNLAQAAPVLVSIEAPETDPGAPPAPSSSTAGAPTRAPATTGCKRRAT